MDKKLTVLITLGLAALMTVGLASVATATPDLSPDGKSCPCHDEQSAAGAAPAAAPAAPAAAPAPAPAAVPAPAPTPVPAAVSTTPAPATASAPLHGQAVSKPAWPAKPGAPAVVLKAGGVSTKVGNLMVAGHAMVAVKDLAAFFGVEAKEDSLWHDTSLALPLSSLVFMRQAPWASVNGSPVTVACENVERDGLLFAPVTTVAKMLGAHVSWNAKTMTAQVDFK